jgi:hypothetical protein
MLNTATIFTGLCFLWEIRAGGQKFLRIRDELKERESTDQTVRRRPLTAEALVLSQVCPCEICGRQSGTRTGFSQSASVVHSQYHSTLAPYSPVRNKAYRANLILFTASPVQSQIYKQFKSHCIAQYFSERFRVQRVGELTKIWNLLFPKTRISNIFPPN